MARLYIRQLHARVWASHGAVHPPTGAWARPTCCESPFWPDAGSGEPYACLRKVTGGAHPPSEPEEGLARVCGIVDVLVHLQPPIRTEPLRVGVVGRVLRHLPAGGRDDMVNTSGARRSTWARKRTTYSQRPWFVRGCDTCDILRLLRHYARSLGARDQNIAHR